MAPRPITAPTLGALPYRSALSAAAGAIATITGVAGIAAEAGTVVEAGITEAAGGADASSPQAHLRSGRPRRNPDEQRGQATAAWRAGDTEKRAVVARLAGLSAGCVGSGTGCGGWLVATRGYDRELCAMERKCRCGIC
jgi:hypothetical protein